VTTKKEIDNYIRRLQVPNRAKKLSAPLLVRLYHSGIAKLVILKMLEPEKQSGLIKDLANTLRIIETECKRRNINHEIRETYEDNNLSSNATTKYFSTKC
jgi:hypothetical protein